MSISVVIAYYSGYGHTARQAQAVASGAASVLGVSAALRDVTVLDEPLWQALADAEAIFGTPPMCPAVAVTRREPDTAVLLIVVLSSRRGRVSGACRISNVAKASSSVEVTALGHSRASSGKNSFSNP
jgi:carbon monoxide dehydrogenase subunit G